MVQRLPCPNARLTSGWRTHSRCDGFHA
jgi:hypothetical protein